MKHFGQALVCLGYENERHGASSILVSFGMASFHPVNTSMEDCKVFESNDRNSTVLGSDHSLYPCLLGEPNVRLRYLLSGTRPDIAFANEEMVQIWESPTSLL